MFPIILTAVVILFAGVLILAATRPDTCNVQRSTTISAAPQKIFPLINDFHNWGSWSPYEKLDPGMSRSLSGSECGKGAVYAWEGNGKAGVGRMEIVETAPPSKVRIKLDFSKPFECSNIVEFALEPQGDDTRVSWDMRAASPYIAKLMGIFINMDKMIGRDFETGLATLKAVAER